MAHESFVLGGEEGRLNTLFFKQESRGDREGDAMDLGSTDDGRRNPLTEGEKKEEKKGHL